MAWPPFTCASCGHPAGDEDTPVHAQAAPHPCGAEECGCAAFDYNGYRASEFEGGGGSGGGGGASGGW